MNLLGEFLKKRRNELKLSLQDVADGVGVSNTTVFKWEGGTDVAGKHFIPLAKVLNTTLDILCQLASGKTIEDRTKIIPVINTEDYIEIDARLRGDCLWQVEWGYYLFDMIGQIKGNRKILYNHNGEVNMYDYFFSSEGVVFLLGMENKNNIRVKQKTFRENLIGTECGILKYSQIPFLSPK